jgi:hypothetical protein
MNAPKLRGMDVPAGSDLFRIASLLLYATLLFNVILPVFANHVTLSRIGILAVVLLIALLVFSYMRYFWRRATIFGEKFLLPEVAITTFIIVIFAQHDLI